MSKLPVGYTMKKSDCFLQSLSKIFFGAEREGFEPPEPRSSTVFKTAAFDHSAIFPRLNVAITFSDTKVVHFFAFAKK